MRGKRDRLAGLHRRRRIIPAHAGQTTTTTTWPRWTADHPRACGANGWSDIERLATDGSSPRMRGKRKNPHLGRRAHRIIPAHAGQTLRPCLERRRFSDHPRACGANSSVILTETTVSGSSPRMRGKPVRANHLAHSTRIIPAHAGQTRRAFASDNGLSDHPRACGANPVAVSRSTELAGSSPRMRGKHDTALGVTAGNRIIPAHAGQTVANQETGEINPDHPRACGANVTCTAPPRATSGSSPRMRGIQDVDVKTSWVNKSVDE